MHLNNNELSVSRWSIEDLDNIDSHANNDRKTIKKIIFEKLFTIRTRNFKLMLLTNFLKRKFNIKKSPTKKGYGQFLNIEEKRYGKKRILLKIFWFY